MIVTRKKRGSWKAFAKELRVAVQKAELHANHRAMARTCRFLDETQMLDRLATERQGVWFDDGGGVCNSYSYGAYTSAIGFAWWTDGRGTLYVRVEGDRVPAKKRSFGRARTINVFDFDGPWAAVFPERARKLAKRQEARVKRYLHRRGTLPPEGAYILIPRYSALAPEGVLFWNEDGSYVCVRAEKTGRRMHITVPHRFVNPESKAFQRAEAWGLAEFGSRERGRVISALAYAAGQKPKEYFKTIKNS